MVKAQSLTRYPAVGGEGGGMNSCWEMEDMGRDCELWKLARWGNPDPKDMWGLITPLTANPVSFTP